MSTIWRPFCAKFLFCFSFNSEKVFYRFCYCIVEEKIQTIFLVFFNSKFKGVC
jgi:hypothetical protein